MNPNAKEFVPAHILKKRQEEAEAKRLGEVTDKLDEVNLDKDDKNATNNSDLVKTKVQPKKDGSTTSSDNQEKPNQNQGQIRDRGDERNNPDETVEAKTETEANHYNNDIHDNNHHQQHKINGQTTNDLGQNHTEDSYLLKAGENYCEFNGEQFIIPGDDEEYEPEISNSGYDFGNEEDNDNEDITNAFEQFLGNLPE